MLSSPIADERRVTVPERPATSIATVVDAAFIARVTFAAYLHALVARIFHLLCVN